MKEVKCILTDYAGVLSLPQDEHAIEKMASILGISIDKFNEIYWRHREVYDLGKLSGSQYWKISCDWKYLSEDEIRELIILDCMSWSHLNPVSLDWMNELKLAGHQISLFSNMPFELTAYLKSQHEWFSIFDHLFFSCELGIVKPDPKSFQKVCVELHRAPDEVLFIDDKSDNVHGAQEAGLEALHFRDVHSVREMVRKSYEL